MEFVYATLGFPKNIAPIGDAAHDIDRLLVTIHIFMGVVFIGWLIYFIYCLVRFRSSTKSPKPIPKALPGGLEVAFAGFEIILLVAVSIPLFQRLRQPQPASSQSLQVRIVGEQYAWNIHYPGEDKKFGRTKIDLVEASNPLGLDVTDENAKDDLVVVNQLNVPVNQSIEIKLTAKDVIHGFYLPELRVKQDAVPGSESTLWFTAGQTGQFEIACTQLCGLGHYRMKGAFHVQSEDDFKSWWKSESEIMKQDYGL